jgi:hypothetical protein
MDERNPNSGEREKRPRLSPFPFFLNHPDARWAPKKIINTQQSILTFV